MHLLPGESVPLEEHDDTEQGVAILSGYAVAKVEGKFVMLKPGESTIIEPKVRHGLWNVTEQPLEMLFTYRPPAHPHDLVQDIPDEPTKGEELNDALFHFARVGPPEPLKRMLTAAVYSGLSKE
jgi:mannose-6-phosphate isomerase-like protein (cupin superfamily)